ncbi:hypothetical protein OB955_04185 [Halobacteria archaeon AArc-m2/3/4]|uniref:Glycine zipper domain-containing protein n=1 Tax=Natronoglomus mannanivorans TaxID=2979990 RepID=A0ABT2QAK2_9EURY|nr:hypothetical protein [Halobacteria archaeon AArc-m2/3/4]
MDYKDGVVISLALLSGLVGASIGGLLGLFAGIVVGAGFGATWAYRSDLQERALHDKSDQPYN